MVRLMFVDKSRPLTHSGVRFPGLDGAEYETDGEGRIRVELEPGDHHVEVETSEGWVDREFTIAGDSGLVVIDLRDSRGDVRQTRQYFDTGTDRDLGDRYEFLEELGRGGMGVVVRARDTLLNRDVAIKILTPELQGSSEAERIFMTEARSMAKLSHGNLVAVHDVISEGGHSMMVVEFITGQNLEEVIDAQGSLSQKAVIRIGIQVCRVIDYLHSEGVIHRDLKPANLMIEGDETVKLIDFGLARSLEQIANRGTKIRGTPAYMAPEQVLGDDLSAATDIYQIGVTLFEALTGELPFAKGDVAYQHVHKEPPTTEEAGNNIFPALAELVDSCLSKEPSERPESARVLMEELQALEEVLTSGRISAVQLRESGVLEDSAGQPASTAQPAEIAETTGAATGGGSLPEMSTGGAPQQVADSEGGQTLTPAGPSRWLLPAVIALLLVAGAAFLFADQFVGGEPGESAKSPESAGKKAESEAAPPEARAAPAAPDPGEAILSARAVSSAGQIVQSANAAARAVVELSPGEDSTPEPTSGARPSRGDSDASAGRGAPPEPEGASARRDKADSPPVDQAEPPVDAQPDEVERSASADKSDDAASDGVGSNGALETESSEARVEDVLEAQRDSLLQDDGVDTSEVESPASATPEEDRVSGDPESGRAGEDIDPVPSSEPSGVTPEPEAGSSAPAEEKAEDEQPQDEEEREERSAPVSF
jgi:serine/threonine-protein kinase